MKILKNKSSFFMILFVLLIYAVSLLFFYDYFFYISSFMILVALTVTVISETNFLFGNYKGVIDSETKVVDLIITDMQYEPPFLLPKAIEKIPIYSALFAQYVVKFNYNDTYTIEVDDKKLYKYCKSLKSNKVKGEIIILTYKNGKKEAFLKHIYKE